MSYICKQIWLPPLFPTVKGSICVIATLEKNELITWDFFQATQGICLPQWSFNWQGHEQPGLTVSGTTVLLNPSSTLLQAGREHPGRAVLPCSLHGRKLWLWYVSQSAACCAWKWVAGWFCCVRLQSTAFLVQLHSGEERFTIIAHVVKRFYSRHDLLSHH